MQNAENGSTLVVCLEDDAHTRIEFERQGGKWVDKEGGVHTLLNDNHGNLFVAKDGNMVAQRVCSTTFEPYLPEGSITIDDLERKMYFDFKLKKWRIPHSCYDSACCGNDEFVNTWLGEDEVELGVCTHLGNLVGKKTTKYSDVEFPDGYDEGGRV